MPGKMCSNGTGVRSESDRLLYQRYYSLADVGYGVHPAANANLVAYIWRVAELVHYSDVIGIGSLEELTLQRYGVDLKRGEREE